VILRGFVREGKRKRDTNKKQSEAGNVSECVRAWRGGVGRNGGGWGGGGGGGGGRKGGGGGLESKQER